MRSNQPGRKIKPVAPGSGASLRIAQMLRVDHAGETAAVGIYRGQKAVFDGLPHKQYLADNFAEMEADEQVHLDAFHRLLQEHQQRPTALIGLWQAMSFGLGVGTALLGEKAAHACTEAVETVIAQHYQDQIDELDANHNQPELRKMFVQFRQEELEHRDHAIEGGAKDAPAYALLSAVIGLGCKAAIRLSEKV